MDQRPNCKNYKTLLRKHRHKSWWPGIRQCLFRYDTNRKSNNNKKEKLDFTNSKKKKISALKDIIKSQSNLEGKKWSWRNQGPWLQSILQRFSNQNSMVLTQWNCIQSPEINLSTHLWPLIYVKGGKNIKWRKYHLFNKWNETGYKVQR